jgi:hypothetical protein
MLLRRGRPVRELVPMILRRVIDEDLRGRVRRLAIFEIGVEEWNEDSFAEVRSRVTLPLERAKVCRRTIDLAVIPRPHDQMVVGGHPFGFEGLPGMDGAIHILLIPQALQPHGGNGGWMGGDQFIERLPLPEGIVCGMRREAVPKAELLKAILPGKVAG